MKSKVGKITGATLALLLIVLMAANLIMPLIKPTQATPIRDMREVPGGLNRLADMVACEARGAYGTIYYCDNNHGDDLNDGSSWQAAFKTLAVAMAASHAKIASGGHATDRNTIYYMADTETADMTKLAQKTDIVGVGSYDAGKRPGITGSWIIPDTVDYMGCRFYNMYFTDTGASALFDIDTQTGLEFHNCRFEGGSGGLTTIGLQVEESSWLIVDGCEFSCVSATAPFTTAAISVVNDTNPIYGCKIMNSIISTQGIGIDWNETESYNCWIINNNLYTDGMGIDSEDIAGLNVIGNRHVTTLGEADNTSNDFNILYGVDNIVTGGTGTVYIPSPSDF